MKSYRRACVAQCAHSLAQPLRPQQGRARRGRVQTWYRVECDMAKPRINWPPVAAQPSSGQCSAAAVRKDFVISGAATRFSSDALFGPCATHTLESRWAGPPRFGLPSRFLSRARRWVRSLFQYCINLSAYAFWVFSSVRFICIPQHSRPRLRPLPPLFPFRSVGVQRARHCARHGRVESCERARSR